MVNTHNDEPNAVLAALLTAQVFQHSGNQAEPAVPSTETPIIVTLDQLLPYDRNPRKVRNPKYEEIKASIRERGLDAPPGITQRPGESSFRIHSGGTTRLTILRELWTETKNERFYRIQCLFRPWPKRGDIVVLTGHLAENDMRGHLTFIERALGVEDARALYESESGKPLSQSELARRLTADGYPTQQSHVSRMRDAVQHLLPCIPKLLFSGLGRHQIEKLAVFRNAGNRVWEVHAKHRPLGIDFTELFQEVLSQFDGDLADFSQQRLQDELIGRMSELLGVDYDILGLDLNTNESRQVTLRQDPEVADATSSSNPIALTLPSALPEPKENRRAQQADNTQLSESPDGLDSSDKASPLPSRHDAIEQLVSAHTGNAGVDVFEPFWPIPPEIDQPIQLRELTAQVALDLAGEQRKYMARTDSGIGVQCSNDASEDALLSFISSLSANKPTPLVELLVGSRDLSRGAQRLTDADLLKLFQLIRLARRLTELGTDSTY